MIANLYHKDIMLGKLTKVLEVEVSAPLNNLHTINVPRIGQPTIVYHKAPLIFDPDAFIAVVRFGVPVE